MMRVLDEIIAQRGAPLSIRCDNGPELTSRHFLSWSSENKSSWYIFNRANRHRTPMWGAFTEG
jgi:hypothetical protein